MSLIVTTGLFKTKNHKTINLSWHACDLLLFNYLQNSSAGCSPDLPSVEKVYDAMNHLKSVLKSRSEIFIEKGKSFRP